MEAFDAECDDGSTAAVGKGRHSAWQNCILFMLTLQVRGGDLNSWIIPFADRPHHGKIVARVQSSHCQEARWHDERDSEFQDVGLEGCWALVVNVKASRRWRPMTSGRHWYGMKMINGDW